MKKNINKIFLVLIINLLLIFPKVNAQENNNIIDFSKKGSITITLEDLEDNKFIEGAEVSLYHIATATEENHLIKFTYTESFKDCDASLTDLTEESLPISIENCIKEDTASIKEISNQNGIAKFTNLDLGIYLVTQTNKVEGYSTFDSFIVSIPNLEDNKWIYDLKASPKTEIYKVIDILVEKVWNTSDNNIPSSIEVALYKGDILIDTIKLNEENNWMYTWERIAKSDDYKVLEINVPAGYTDTYRQVDNKFIITNTKTLVQTGLSRWLVQLLLVLGTIFITAGIIVEKGKNHE